MPTPQVLLRLPAAADAVTLAGWESDRLLCSEAGWVPHADRAAAVAWWRNHITTPRPELVRLLALHEEQVVGYVDLYGNEPDARELGYLVAPSHRWGHGLGSATARAGLAYGFGTLGLARIWAGTAETNTASVRVLQRIGMRMTGAVSSDAVPGRKARQLGFEMLREEWPSLDG